MKRTKVIVMAALLLIAFSLAACSKSGGNSSGGTNPPSNVTTTPPAAAPSATPSSNQNNPVSGGTEWPNYDYLQGVPKPPFSVTKIDFQMRGLPVTAYYSGVTYDEMKTFSDVLKAAGWSVGEGTMFNNFGNRDENLFNWYARNGEGNGSFQITLSSNKDGTGSMLIGMPK
jgi:hypothetical protein